MEEIIIRNLTKEDYFDVFELEKQVHREHYSKRPDLYNDVSDLFPREYYYSIIDNKNSIMIGIECNNKIVAIIMSEVKETSNISVIKKRKYCYIDDIVVDKSYRRKGYAKRLFNELREELKKLNICDIELTVWPFNKGAIAFYESIGMSAKNIKYEFKSNNELNTETIELNTTQSAK
ncbi:MAG: GNAT family N-acetyltransferase [Bacilli bacterium]|nr:GNAT family N-acetyltransferase [Bacilli bacterium]